MKRDIHDALFAFDQAAAQTLLRDPGKTDLFYGFDIPARSMPTVGPEFELACATLLIGKSIIV